MKKTLRYTTIGLAGIAGLAFAASAQAVELNVVSWGGAYTASQLKAYHQPYMAANPDVQLNSLDYSGGLAEVRAQAEAGNVTWDLVDVVVADAIRGCDEGLFMELDHNAMLEAAPDGTPPMEDFLEGTVSDCFVPQIIYSFAFAYRTDAFKGEQPKTMADVFDLEKFPGKRTLQRSPVNNLEWALIADGVPVNEVYDVLDTPEGIERAFAKLDTIKSEVIWWTEGAVPAQLLADGEVVFGNGYNGRLFSAIEEEKQPLAMIWDGQVLDIDGWAVPADGKNIDEVLKFMRFATDTQRLADQAKYISYGPARKSSLPLVSTHAELGIDMEPHMPTKYAELGFLTNFQWWADNRDELNERFEAWLQQ
ncbi:ABC transporter substrate-binding protein [Pelagibius sp. 7325]|uniref:ABC transporter substrate-binding protein n=1 Tax=Pelagibius sp. 7325 TaxID=3131994 RepID=UPI0030EE7F1A